MKLALCSKIVEIVEQYKLDLIHAHYAIPHAYATYMATADIETKKNLCSLCNYTARYRYYFGWGKHHLIKVQLLLV